VDLPAIYAEALALGMRTLLAQAAGVVQHVQHPYGLALGRG
jgi:hypothetical protein